MRSGAPAVGIDLVDLDRFEAVAARRGARLLERLFTPAERDSCAATARPLMHLAARFAAKEAVIKALGGDGVTWRQIELPRVSGRGIQPRLTGRAARLLGRRRLAVSITHTDRAAAAVAIILP
jgi:holo-[acyl-carrier protein] synthase